MLIIEMANKQNDKKRIFETIMKDVSKHVDQMLNESYATSNTGYEDLKMRTKSILTGNADTESKLKSLAAELSESVLDAINIAETIHMSEDIAIQDRCHVNLMKYLKLYNFLLNRMAVL